MSKTKLAVYIGDEVYQHRFVRCLINHYQNQFEVHSFSDISEILAFGTQECEVLIIGDCDKEVLEKLAESGKYLLYLKENQEEVFTTEKVVFVDKYQEVFKIVDSIEKLLGIELQKVEKNGGREGNRRMIGVYSLTQEKLQLPFAAALCSICGERQSVLLLDLQIFSGLASTEENWGNEKMSDILSLEDLMAVATTGVYTKGRLLAGIGKADGFAYVHGVKNPECLAEGSVEIYNTMIEMLSKELGYDCVVINFGSICSGMLELMDQCDECYFLTGKEKEAEWRESHFKEVFEKRGKGNFLCRVKRIEIPAVYSSDDGWHQLAEKWRWNELGSELRQKLWENDKNEAGGVPYYGNWRENSNSFR